MSSTGKEEGVVSTIRDATFIEDVAAFMEGKQTDAVLAMLSDNHQGYKLLEMKLDAQRRSLESKHADIKKALDVVELIMAKGESEEPLNTNFELSDGVYAKAVIHKPKEVCLWLGANVMLAYEFEEARALLKKNLDTAARSLEGLRNDISKLRDNVTITEVCMSRVFNHDVKIRRQQKALEAAAGAAQGS
eukprot:jgi/Mesvir1/27905/Mv03419-RA.1